MSHGKSVLMPLLMKMVAKGKPPQRVEADFVILNDPLNRIERDAFAPESEGTWKVSRFKPMTPAKLSEGLPE